MAAPTRARARARARAGPHPMCVHTHVQVGAALSIAQIPKKRGTYTLRCIIGFPLKCISVYSIARYKGRELPKGCNTVL